MFWAPASMVGIKSDRIATVVKVFIVIEITWYSNCEEISFAACSQAVMGFGSGNRGNNSSDFLTY